ncbi:MAG: Rad52/Rad22 family DNA repair protein [Thiomicrorhabdus sp.]|jgi:hypothetical protein|nr:Rad52/Rad22 family DNA repair protein [Thiomicrorhabdus sp.]
MTAKNSEVQEHQEEQDYFGDRPTSPPGSPMPEERNYQAELCEPFEESELEWRADKNGVTKKAGDGQGKGWALVFAYVTNRAIQERLDAVFGCDGWENIFTAAPQGDGFMCGLKCKINGNWITKWDGAEPSVYEPLKGGLSGAMKRAAVQWGIGRYLYNLDAVFATCTEVANRRSAKLNYIELKDRSGNVQLTAQWATPDIPKWAIPSAKARDFIARVNEATTLLELKEAYTDGYRYAKAFSRAGLLDRLGVDKETKKAELEAVESTRVTTAYDRVARWLDHEITTQMHGANESIIKLAADKIKGSLIIICREEGLNKDASEMLLAILRDRIKTEIKGA